MSKYEIPFLTACIQAFGRRFDMTRQAAFRYLHEHKGLHLLTGIPADLIFARVIFAQSDHAGFRFTGTFIANRCAIIQK